MLFRHLQKLIEFEAFYRILNHFVNVLNSSKLNCSFYKWCDCSLFNRWILSLNFLSIWIPFTIAMDNSFCVIIAGMPVLLVLVLALLLILILAVIASEWELPGFIKSMKSNNFSLGLPDFKTMRLILKTNSGINEMHFNAFSIRCIVNKLNKLFWRFAVFQLIFVCIELRIRFFYKFALFQP